MTNYQKEQLDNALKDHDFRYNIKIKLQGSSNESKWLDISLEQLNKIEDILK